MPAINSIAPAPKDTGPAALPDARPIRQSQLPPSPLTTAMIVVHRGRRAVTLNVRSAPERGVSCAGCFACLRKTSAIVMMATITLVKIPMKYVLWVAHDTLAMMCPRRRARLWSADTDCRVRTLRRRGFR